MSVDMIFPQRWTVPLECKNLCEIIENGTEGNYKNLSFAVPYDDENLVNSLEKCVDGTIKYNIEREEKDNLFQDKVKELKNIFEKQKLSELKNLKFDIDNITSILGDEGELIEGNTQGNAVVREREESVPTQT